MDDRRPISRPVVTVDCDLVGVRRYEDDDWAVFEPIDPTLVRGPICVVAAAFLGGVPSSVTVEVSAVDQRSL